MDLLNIDYAAKLTAIRKAEGFSQRSFSVLAGLPLNLIRNYESGRRVARADVVERVVMVEPFKKYTLWLLRDKSNLLAGQIAPALSLNGSVGLVVLGLRRITVGEGVVVSIH